MLACWCCSCGPRGRIINRVTCSTISGGSANICCTLLQPAGSSSSTDFSLYSLSNMATFAMPTSTVVANTGPFQVSMEHENLCVIFIPIDVFPTFSWWVMREYCLDRRRRSCFHSILMDDEGCSLVCSASALPALEAINSAGLQFSSQRWRAFIINVVGSAAEFPGAVHYLADSLSQEGLSILHISTFESEVFLVQEQDLERACAIFRRTGSPKELAGLIEQGQKQRGGPVLTNLPTSTRGITGEQVSGTVGEGTESDGDAMTELSVSQHQFKEGFILRVIPGQVMLARLNDDFSLRQCSDVLSELMLFDERYSPLERMVRRNASAGPGVPSSSAAFGAAGVHSEGTEAGHPPAPSDSPFDVHIPHQRKRGDSGRDRDRDRDRATFMWGLWQCENELTFLLEESDVDKFPEGALMLSPQRWKLIKLCGRAIDFDETGIVSAMSKIDQNVPSLNISTSTTNCTLVPEELLDQTLNCLSQVLHCPFHDSENQ